MNALTAAWTPRQRRFFFVSFAAGILWSLVFLLASDGWSLDDEISHYLFSRSVWQNPLLIFDAWTRAGRNVFHLIPAHFGLTAARVWTLAGAALCVWVTTLLAARLGARRAWLVPLALCFQPWFVELSWGVLTQTPFMLCLATGIWLLAASRWKLSGLAFGCLPLIRHEGLALLALWFAVLAWQAISKRALVPFATAAICAAAPLAFYNLAAWLCLGEMPSRVFLNAKPTELYGHGTPWHFFEVAPRPAGLFTLALAAAGLPALWRSSTRGWPLIFYPAYFLLHSLIFWFGLFASGGYYHFLMPMAPGLAVAAVFGADTLLDARSKNFVWLGRLLLAGAVVQGLALTHLMYHPLDFRLGIRRDPIHHALQEALDWRASQRPDAKPVICHHICADFLTDTLFTPEKRRLDTLPAAALPAGSIVIWESKYADVTGLPLSDLRSGEWREAAVFGGGNVRVFEKDR